jgi:hypothetical protein
VCVCVRARAWLFGKKEKGKGGGREEPKRE